VDVLFVIDASGSVGQNNFNLAQQFIIDAIELLNVGPSDIRVAAMMFHFEPLPQFDFDDFSTKRSVQDAVRNMVYPTEELFGTATGSALDFVRTNLLRTSAGYRGGDAIIYVITDGASQEEPSFVERAANDLKATGAEVVAIGITDLVNSAQLAVIASGPENVIEVDDFDRLDDAVRDDVVSRVCEPDTTHTVPTFPASTTAAGPTEICEGTISTVTQQSCSCNADCHTCSWTAGVAGSCFRCKNAQYLQPNGECAADCPPGHSKRGTWQILSCVPCATCRFPAALTSPPISC
jgi:hypothetical protein